MQLQNLERRFEKQIQHLPGFVYSVLSKTRAEVYMSDIVKICINCGPLKLENTVFRKINGKYSHHCKKCTNSYHKKAYQKQIEIHKNRLESGEFNIFIPKKNCKTHGDLLPEQIQVRGKYMKCRLCMYKNKKRWEQENYEIVNKGKVKRYYKNPKLRSQERILGKRKITEDQYYKMFEDQNYTCAICKNTKGNPISKTKKGERPLCIDHCHKTGKIRKLLCLPCNTLLGNAKENINTLQEAINYLKEFNYDIER